MFNSKAIFSELEVLSEQLSALADEAKKTDEGHKRQQQYLASELSHAHVRLAAQQERISHLESVAHAVLERLQVHIELLDAQPAGIRLVEDAPEPKADGRRRQS